MGHDAGEALQTATVHAAAYLNNNWDEKVGTVDKGKFADLVAVAGNPLQDISEMLRIKFVMKGGAVFRDELPKRRRVRPAAGRSKIRRKAEALRYRRWCPGLVSGSAGLVLR